jgi:alpha-galactosidase
MSKGPKITVIGAGSYFFGKQIIHQMATSPVMAGGTLALVDTNQHTLAVMLKLARRIFARTRCGVKLIGSTRRREVMKGSDFMVLTFSDRNAHFRGIDTEIAARHGIRMCSSDTIGPGGIFRALREIPHALAIARDARQLAPHCWIINFVNPTAVLGIALRRYAPEMASFAICDGHHEPYATMHWCKMAGILPPDASVIPPDVLRKLDLAISGVNHFTWLLRFRYDGKDMFPLLRRKLVESAAQDKTRTDLHSKSIFNATYQLELFDVFGVIPDTISHTKEYVPYYQGYGHAPVQPEPIRLFDAEQRARDMQAAWKLTEGYADGKPGASQFLKQVGSDHASDIMESMWGNLRKPFFINTFNQGAVPNMAADAFLELRCDLDMRGPRPQPVGDMPRGLLGLQQQVLDTHELTAQAAVTGDRAILRRAMLTDPICNNIGDADACIKDLIAAERDALPSCWR